MFQCVFLAVEDTVDMTTNPATGILPTGGSTSPLDVRSECSPNGNDCDINEECRLVLTENLIGYVCDCIKGYTKGLNSQTCIGRYGNLFNMWHVAHCYHGNQFCELEPCL